MRSIKYYVGSCLKCNKLVLVEVNFHDFNEECCLDFSNLKLLKTFNDLEEAKNYISLYKQDEED